MGSFMMLLYRLVYNVTSHTYEVIHSLKDQGCSDNGRDVNAAKNILAVGHDRLAVGIHLL